MVPDEIDLLKGRQSKAALYPTAQQWKTWDKYKNKGQRMWILRPFYFAFSFAVLMEEISMTRMLVQAEFKALYCSSAM
ncbi:MAG: hypothetical protein IJB76_00845 [Clostridia bacterium]|nr:hypothetical protein [Clostridia bacterium]